MNNLTVLSSFWSSDMVDDTWSGMVHACDAQCYLKMLQRNDT